MTMEPAAAPPTRRLSAVLLADVVGYSRMMSDDEETAHARLMVHVRELIDPTIARYRGRHVRSMGDGMLIEFPSALDAVRCGLDIQSGLAERQSDEPDRIRLRVGINTGDVLADEHDIYGNSVNITARLEALATPGAVCVSQNIYDQTRGPPDLFFTDRGWHRVKNFRYPIRVFEVSHEPTRISLLRRFRARQKGWTFAGAIAAAGFSLAALNFAEQPKVVDRTNTIVVLPFRNVDGKMEDNYLADAITEELTTELCRLRRAWVIASIMAFNYKDKTIDLRQIGREIGVRYALQGSVRRAGAIVHVTTQLIDTESGVDLWADRFAYETTSLFELQDAVIGHIAGSLHDEVMRADIRHEVGTLAADGNALDERLRTMSAKIGILTPEKLRDALHHAEEGLRMDPSDPHLMAQEADIILSAHLNGWEHEVLRDLVSQGKESREQHIEHARQLAETAISLNPNIALAHYDLGFVYRLRGDHKAALRKFEDALQIDRNFAPAYAQKANQLVFNGQPEAAIAPAAEAARLDPDHQSIGVFHWVRGRAYFAMGRYEDAAEWLRKSIEVRPNLWFSHAWLVAAYALSGQDDAAKAELAKFQSQFPKYDLGRITEIYSRDEQYRTPTLEKASKQLFAALRRAGLT